MREEVGLASSHHLRLQYVSISAIPNFIDLDFDEYFPLCERVQQLRHRAYAIWARRIQHFGMYL